MSTPVLIVAEIGSVHDGSFGNARKLIEAVARCGADAVKFQMHIASEETLPDAPPPPYFKDEERYEYFERTSFTLEQWRSLRELAHGLGLRFIVSPFCDRAVDMLVEEVGVDMLKIASGEVTNIPMLEKVAAAGRGVLLSSGMSTWTELDEAVKVLEGKVPELVVMQCTSSYPCPPERVGLNVIREMRDRYGLPTGLSDHTLGMAASLAAVALGATVVERHITFSRQMYGSDAAHSLELDEFVFLCREIRELERMLASPVDKNDVGDLKQMRKLFQKSVVTTRPLAAGSLIGEGDLAAKKPGDGLPPRLIGQLVGRRMRKSVPAGHMMSWEDIE